MLPNEAIQLRDRPRLPALARNHKLVGERHPLLKQLLQPERRTRGVVRSLVLGCAQSLRRTNHTPEGDGSWWKVKEGGGRWRSLTASSAGVRVSSKSRWSLASSTGTCLPFAASAAIFSWRIPDAWHQAGCGVRKAWPIAGTAWLVWVGWWWLVWVWAAVVGVGLGGGGWCGFGRRWLVWVWAAVAGVGLGGGGWCGFGRRWLVWVWAVVAGVGLGGGGWCGLRRLRHLIATRTCGGSLIVLWVEGHLHEGLELLVVARDWQALALQ